MTLVDQCVKRACSLEHRKTKSDLTNASVPAGTFVSADLIGGDSVVLCCLVGSLLRLPFEVGTNNPHPVQNDGKFSGNRNLGFAQPASLRKPNAPGFER